MPDRRTWKRVLTAWMDSEGVSSLLPARIDHNCCPKCKQVEMDLSSYCLMYQTARRPVKPLSWPPEGDDPMAVDDVDEFEANQKYARELALYDDRQTMLRAGMDNAERMRHTHLKVGVAFCFWRLIKKGV